MAQNLENIMDLLQDLKRANDSTEKNFKNLLNTIGSKVDLIDKNMMSVDLLKSYLSEITKTFSVQYNTSLVKFADIEQAIKAIYNEQSQQVKTDDLKELFDVFSKNMNHIYTEGRQQKAILTGIDSRIADLSSTKNDKDDIVRNINLLKNDLDNFNKNYNKAIDNLDNTVKSITQALFTSDKVAITDLIVSHLEKLTTPMQEIISSMKSLGEKETVLENILNTVATNESLKYSIEAINVISDKLNSLFSEMNGMPKLNDFDNLKDDINEVNNNFAKVASVDNIAEVVEITEDLRDQTRNIQTCLATITSTVDKLPSTSNLEMLIANLFKDVETLMQEVNSSNIEENSKEFALNLHFLKDEIKVIKNVLNDIGEMIDSKVTSAINSLAENIDYSLIIDKISLIVQTMPNKESVENLYSTIAENSKLSEEIITKTDSLLNKVDKLATQSDIESISANQIQVSQALQNIANKEDFDKLKEKVEDIKNDIKNKNFEKEFENIYDKSSSIEEWLMNSKVKENTEEINLELKSKAEQKDLNELLRVTEKIITNVEELTYNTDIKKVNRTVAEVFQFIEELKNDLLNNVEMHSDSIMCILSELEASMDSIVKFSDFNNFIVSMNSFVAELKESFQLQGDKTDKILDYQQDILEKISDINIDKLNEKFVSFSEFVEKANNIDFDVINASISDIKSFIKGYNPQNLQSIDINNDILVNIKDYIEELKDVISSNNTPISVSLENSIKELDSLLKDFSFIDKDKFIDIINKLDSLNLSNANNEMLDQSKTELGELKSLIRNLIDSYKSVEANNEIPDFVSKKLSEISKDLDTLSTNIDSKLETGFTYNAELISEKTNLLLDLIKNLRHENTDNLDLYEKLSVTDTKLIDIKQGLDLLSTDVIDATNNKIENVVAELAQLRDIITSMQQSGSSVLGEKLENIHNNAINEIKVNPNGVDTFQLDLAYENISTKIEESENNIKKFVVNDIDAVLIKVDLINEVLEKSLANLVPPEPDSMKELVSFKDELDKFQEKQNQLFNDATQMIKQSISDEFKSQKEQIKSLLSMSYNSEAIIKSIDELKKIILCSDNLSDFSKITKSDNSEKIKSLQQPIEEFIDKTKEFSSNNTEIQNVFNIIQTKLNYLVQKSDNVEAKDINFKQESSNIIEILDILGSDISNLHEQIEKIIVQDKHDNTSLSDLTQSVISNNLTLTKLYDFINNENWLNDLKAYIKENFGSEILVTQLKTIDNKLDDIKNKYDSSESENKAFEEFDKLHHKLDVIVENDTESLDFDDIQYTLFDISDKLNNLNEMNFQSYQEEFKNEFNLLQMQLDDLNANLNLDYTDEFNDINNKLDILSQDLTSDKLEDIKSSIEKFAQEISDAISSANKEYLDSFDTIKSSDLKITNILEQLNSKIDILAKNDDSLLDEDINEIKNLIVNQLNAIDDIKNNSQIDSLRKKLEELLSKVNKFDENFSDNDIQNLNITNILESLNHKIDILAQTDDSLLEEDIIDIKDLIYEQMLSLETIKDDSQIEILKKCLFELSIKLNNFEANLSDTNKDTQKCIRDMKESIVGAVVNIFEQVSFIEESEDIKDFVEEKTDEINQNLLEVTNQLKAIQNDNNESEYTYSMQDIESDLAKLRLALNHLQEDKNSETTSKLLEHINYISSTVEQLKNSMTEEEFFNMKLGFDSINNDMQNLNVLTNQLNNSLNTNLCSKVDNVTKLLENSQHSDDVMKQALIYIGEWIDSATSSINNILSNSVQIKDIKSSIEDLNKVVPAQAKILNSLEKQFIEQQERIDRLEMSMDKILSLLEDLDESRVQRKIDNIDKQLSRLSLDIRKLTSYVD